MLTKMREQPLDNALSSSDVEGKLICAAGASGVTDVTAGAACTCAVTAGAAAAATTIGSAAGAGGQGRGESKAQGHV